MISCYKCHKKFKYPYLLKNHLSGKRDCSSILQKETIINQKKPKETIINRFINDDINGNSSKCDISECEYCNKTITKVKLNQHIRNACKKVPSNIRRIYINKYNNRKDVKQINNNDISNITNTNTIIKNTSNIKNANINNTNTNINNLNNTINNNIDVNITYNVNPFTDENLSHLTKEEHIKILNTGVNMYDAYLKYIYINEDNLNIYIEDKRKGIVGFMDKDNSISYMRQSKAIDLLTDKNMSDLNNLYDEYEAELEEATKKKANFNLDRYFNDDEDGPVKKEYRDKTYFTILKKSSLAKKRINNLVKLRDKDGNIMSLKDENGDEWVLVNPSKLNSR
jgi:hypothetical protein